MPLHSAITGTDIHEAFHYTQNSDPGAVGAGKYWLDTTSSPYVLKRRNGTDTGWVNVGSAVTYTDENAQDAIGAMLADTNTIDMTYTDATPELKADVRTQMSITSDASGIKLSSDSASPGNNKVYGTDGSGVKGWRDETAASITTLLASALPENVAIILDAALSADGKYSGIVEAGTAGTTLAFGDLVYLAVADSRWELTDANAVSTAGSVKLGICLLAAAADGDPTTLLLFGKVRADAAFPTMTVGAPVYISETAGDITSTAPTTSGAVVRILGHANTADELFFHPSNDWIELA